jgi:DNA-binding NarL/FixJ family response regulator
MRRSTVLIADDHTMVLEGLVRLLEEHDFEVTGAAGDGSRLIDLALQLRPDVIVTDVSMPGLSGLDALALLKAQHVDSKVIILTMHNNPDMAARALRAGASGYLLKHSAGEDLVNAIREVLQGGVYLAAALTQGVMERMAQRPGTSGPELTSRQLQVLRLLMEGRRMKEIAAALGLSPRTVESHKYAMMEALGVQSTAELVKYAIEHRLLVD